MAIRIGIFAWHLANAFSRIMAKHKNYWPLTNSQFLCMPQNSAILNNGQFWSLSQYGPINGFACIRIAFGQWLKMALKNVAILN
jgi:hypothetical protein